ncbi:MAG TPA: L,D-transpeptidase family protein [Dyella sp.]|nr:L,D-transpeptidase family protein [Dyella sp.]
MSSLRRHASRHLPALILGALLGLLSLGAIRAAGSTRFFWHPEIAPSGPVVVVISLDEQHIYVYRNGVAIGVGPISSGKPGYETPPGVYSILQKEREHRSNRYEDAPMPYMQRLTWDGIAMHGGALPGHPASHGCVRLPQAFAEKLFAITRRGGIVVVADARVSPAHIAHPAAVAPIDLTGAPMSTAAVMQPAAPDAPPAGAEPTPVSVVVSTRDRMVHVLRGGLLVDRSPLELLAEPPPTGIVLYVMTGWRRSDSEAPLATALPSWSAYRILGSGTVPEPSQMAGQLQVPEAFGARLQAALVPGSTVLVTDLPGYGNPHGPPYAKLLESEPAPAPAAAGTPSKREEDH